MPRLTQDVFTVAKTAAEIAQGKRDQFTEYAAEMAQCEAAGTFTQTATTYGTCNVTVHTSSGDRSSAIKQRGIAEGMQKLVDAGMNPPNLSFWLTGMAGPRSQAFMCRDIRGVEQYNVILGPGSVVRVLRNTSIAEQIRGGSGVGGGRGVPDRVSDTGPAFRKETRRLAAIVVHEVGHILHNHLDPAKFWRLKAPGQAMNREGTRMEARMINVPGDVGMDVSQYLCNCQNYLELVAEVFCGAVYGSEYSDAVMTEYARAGGPPVPGRTALDLQALAGGAW